MTNEINPAQPKALAQMKVVIEAICGPEGLTEISEMLKHPPRKSAT